MRVYDQQYNLINPQLEPDESLETVVVLTNGFTAHGAVTFIRHSPDLVTIHGLDGQGYRQAVIVPTDHIYQINLVAVKLQPGEKPRPKMGFQMEP